MITRSAITDAVEKLRRHFGETQPQFAQRMNTALVTIARWETSRPPRGEALERLLKIALSEGLEECAGIFRQALAGDVEPAFPVTGSMGIGASGELFENQRERVFAMALVAALRSPAEYGKAADLLEVTLRTALDRIEASLDAAGVTVPMAFAIVLLRSKGENPEQIAESLEMNVATVHQVLMLDQFGLIPERQGVAVTRTTGTARNRRVRRPAQVTIVERKAGVRTARRPRKLSDILESYLNKEESSK